MNMFSKPKDLLVIAGGGTGGHVMAGIAIADRWRAQGLGDVLFVGARGGIEEKLVPRAGYELSLLKIGTLKGADTKQQIKTLLQIPFAFAESLRILIQNRPRAVLGVGGYASGPFVLMAAFIGRFLGCRVAILEQNAMPGFTNKILGSVAHRVYSAFPGLERHFAGSHVMVSGNPVRKEFKPMDAAQRDPFEIFIFGGSQGAKGINDLVLASLPLLKDSWDKIRIHHQTGDREFDRVQAAYQALGFSAQVEKFVYEMKESYQKASLVICRSGSSSLSELASVGRASFLVPFPYAADNHQELNARLFEKNGSARVYLQNSTRPEEFAKGIRELIDNQSLLGEMESKVKSFARPDSDGLIVKDLIQ